MRDTMLILSFTAFLCRFRIKWSVILLEGKPIDKTVKTENLENTVMLESFEGINIV